MLNLSRKEDCCGCSACEQICPKSCIVLETDSEGFWYPSVDRDMCVNCHLCENVCPVQNQDTEKMPLETYAAYNKDSEIRAKSSSGGIFTLVANKILALNGVVFGVKFDSDWNVVFGYTEEESGLNEFRKSKYVQAWLGDTFSKVKYFLEKERFVLFTGTPCQIAGLRKYLRKDYDNLLLMDLICEGVPSPKVWKRYLFEEVSRLNPVQKGTLKPFQDKGVHIKDISFRNKDGGWKNFSFALTYVNANKENAEGVYILCYNNKESAYMQAMFKYLHLRPICYECPFKCCKSHSDITIADYWGITALHPEMDDDKGTSMVFINTEKGKKYCDLGEMRYLKTSYEEAFPFNNIVTSSPRHPNRDKFFSKIDDSDSIIQLLEDYKFTKSYKIKQETKKVLKVLLPYSFQTFLNHLWVKLKDFTNKNSSF